MVLIHGAYENAPANLARFLPVAREFLIYALDTMGQSVMGAQTQLSTRDNSYGEWVVDTTDGLGLERASFIAASFGAGIALRAAAIAPERIEKAVQVVPSGIASGPMLRMSRELFLPWALYFLFRGKGSLLKATAPMMSENDGEFLAFVDAFLRNARFPSAGPRLAARGELAGFTAPTLIFVTDDDLFFPGDKVAARAGEIIPNLADVVQLYGKHMPSRASRELINRRILQFLKASR
ncbi:MAG: Alpha/beta hydrolase family protein [Methanocella sp. PtaU1.Bin125]|nr:MAG: Alpha/beta hydrolase family protein [Methanocella sp. PtaU1.Bin125]